MPLVTKYQKPYNISCKVRKAAKIRSRYNQVPHLTQDTTWESDKTQLNITNKSQELAMNRREIMINTNDPQIKYRLGTVSKTILLEGLKQFHGANLALNPDVDQDTFGKVTKHNKHERQVLSPFPAGDHKATRNRHDSTTHTNMKHN